MKVTLTTDNGSNYINLMEPDEGYVAFFNSSMSADGNVWEGELPKTGDTKIRVYLMRNAARRGESASYTLEVGIE